MHICIYIYTPIYLFIRGLGSRSAAGWIPGQVSCHGCNTALLIARLGEIVGSTRAQAARLALSQLLVIQYSR